MSSDSAASTAAALTTCLVATGCCLFDRSHLRTREVDEDLFKRRLTDAVVLDKQLVLIPLHHTKNLQHTHTHITKAAVLQTLS